MSTFYIAASNNIKERAGFVKFTGCNFVKFTFVRDIREAHPFESYDNADNAAKEMKLICYAILSTSHK